MNTVVGVDRADTGETVRPGDDASAYMGLTDRRIIIVVGDPVNRDSDFVTSHEYTNVTEVIAQTETLTAQVTFETVTGQRWLFTSREGDVKPVQTFLSVVWGESEASEAERTELANHCEALSFRLAHGDWEEFDNRVDAAIETAGTLSDDTSSPRGRDSDGLVTDLHRLIRDRYVLAGRASLTSARQRLDNGDFELSYRRARTAFDRFEEALNRARREGLETDNAMMGLTMADDIADTSLGRLFATGRHQSTNTTDSNDVDKRIEGLEAALDTYETVAALITGDDTLSDDASARAREEAGTTIEALIEARLERAREQRNSAIWEQDVGNPEVARELDQSARADLDRALELASAYPPGDADAIRTHRRELFSKGE